MGTNLEPQNTCKSRDTVTEIKIRIMERQGHVIRIGRYPYSQPEGRPGVGRPEFRWLDDVEADMETLGVKTWRLTAQDRKEWEAKAKLKVP
jgi:hypothetical protein